MAARDEPDHRRQTILIVDDDPDFLFQLQLQLEQAGYRVQAAAGEAEARRMLETETPDLAILDLMMEHMDGGFVLSHHIKQLNPAIPVILVTGVAHETGLEFAVNTPGERSWIKADAVLAKPVRFEQLRRELARLLPED